MAVPPQLEQADIPRPVLDVLTVLKDRGFQAYLVGGCVRDLIREVPPKDFDLATSALPQEVQRCFPRVIPTGIQHGTVTVIAKGNHVEVTTFRSEGEYLDGRRPSSVEFHRDIEVDLSRRDFTINAMAFDPVGVELIDPFGGQVDLAARRIRCVGEASARFFEDGLRPLRAVRFAAVLGFSLDPKTLEAIPPVLESFRKVSQERIREEFQKLLLSARPGEGLRLLLESGLLAAFLPEVSRLTEAGEAFDQAVHACAAAPGELEIRLAALFAPRTAPSDVRDALVRLKFPNKVIDLTVLLVREHGLDTHRSWTDAEVRRWLVKVGPEQFQPVFSLRLALDSAAGDAAAPSRADVLRQQVERVLSERPPLSAKALALNGQQIMNALEVGPSPVVGEATRFLLERVLDDPSANTPETLVSVLREWSKLRSK